MIALDDVDRGILGALQHDARITNQELADRVGLSPSSCLRRVRRLEDIGVLSGYAAAVDQIRVGLPITAFVRITLENHSGGTVQAVEDHIREIPDVVEAFLIAGDHDYLLRVVAASLDDYERILRECIRRIPKLAAVQTTFAFATVKPTSPLPLA